MLDQKILEILAWLVQQPQYKHYAVIHKKLVTFFMLGFLIGSFLHDEPYLRINSSGGLRLIDVTNSCLYLCEKSIDSCYYISTKQHEKMIAKFVNDFFKKYLPESIVDRLEVKFCKDITDGFGLNSIIICKTGVKSTEGDLDLSEFEITGTYLSEIMPSTNQEQFINETSQMLDLKHIIQVMRANFTHYMPLRDEEYFSVVFGCILATKLSNHALHLGSNLDGKPNTVLLTPVPKADEKETSYISVNIGTNISYTQAEKLTENIQFTRFQHNESLITANNVSTYSVQAGVFEYLRFETSDRFYVSLIKMLQKSYSLDVSHMRAFLNGYLMGQGWNKRKVQMEFVLTHQNKYIHFWLTKTPQKCTFIALESIKGSLGNQSIINKICSYISVSKQKFNQKTMQPLLMARKKLMVSHGQVKPFVSIPETIKHQLADFPENLDKITNELNEAQRKLPKDKYAFTDFLKGFFSALQKFRVSIVDANFPNMIRIDNIRQNITTILIVSNNKSETLNSYQNAIQKNIDCYISSYLIVQLTIDNRNGKLQECFTLAENSLQINYKFKSHCGKSENYIENLSSNQSIFNGTENQVYSCKENNKTGSCQRVNNLQNIVQGLRAGVNKIETNLLSSLDIDDRSFMLDEMTYNILTFSMLNFDWETKNIKYETFEEVTEMFHDSIITQYGQVSHLLNIFGLMLDTCSKNTTLNFEGKSFGDLVIKHIDPKHNRLVQIKTESENQVASQASCSEYMVQDYGKLKNIDHDTVCFKNTAMTPDIGSSVTSNVCDQKQVKFQVNLAKSPTNTLYYEITKNGTKKYHIDMKNTSKQMLSLYLQAKPSSESLNELVTTFHVKDITNIKYESLFKIETVSIDVGEHFQIKVFVNLTEHSSVGVILTTLDKFKLVLFPKIDFAYGRDIKHDVLFDRKSFCEGVNNFTFLFTENETQTTHIDISKNEHTFYVTDNNPEQETFIQSTATSNIFRINVFCDGTPQYHECSLKSVEIRVGNLQTALQLVTFKYLCWFLKELKTELKLHLIKHDDQIMIVLFQQNTKTNVEYFLGTVSIVGDVGRILTSFRIEMETMFCFSILDNQLILKPVGINVHDETRFLLLQPEGTVRPVWYILNYSGVTWKFYEYDESLFIELTVLDDKKPVVMICYKYFKYEHSFPKVTLEFIDKVVFISKSIIPNDLW